MILWVYSLILRTDLFSSTHENSIIRFSLFRKFNMLSAELTAIGAAEKVVRCTNVPDPGMPGGGEVLVEVVACSINPADILMVEGNYATEPQTPCPLGIESAGTATAVGAGVTGLKVGDKVMSLGRTNWVQKIRDRAETCIRLPPEIDLAQAAMLNVNVATAHLMLTTYASLAARFIDGTIHVEIEASYPLEKITDAMSHAKREARGGKVQLRPNG